MKKVRLGLFLIVVSWVPIAQLSLAIAHHHSYLTTDAQSRVFRIAIWGLQFIIGFIGLWLVGKLAVESARTEGWKHVPRNLWRLFKSGPTVNNGKC